MRLLSSGSNIRMQDKKLNALIIYLAVVLQVILRDHDPKVDYPDGLPTTKQWAEDLLGGHCPLVVH
jgi:hypothetical protein